MPNVTKSVGEATTTRSRVWQQEEDEPMLIRELLQFLRAQVRELILCNFD